MGMDFNPSINRVAAWVIGSRGALKSLLAALLELHQQLRAAEQAGNYTHRLALFEELKTLPLGAVWDEYCQRNGVPAGIAWMNEIKRYEQTVLAQRPG